MLKPATNVSSRRCELWDTARQLIERSAELGKGERRDLLYISARDNEDEQSNP